MYPWQDLDLDHVTPRALGGAGGPAMLSHRWCNRAAGARLGGRLRRMPPARPVPVSYRTW
jgi:5-methylcytosine-specific restriction endonuclease McrA